MNNTETAGCPLCPRELSVRTELRVHLMVDHRKSAVIEEYVARLEHRDESAAPAP